MDEMEQIKKKMMCEYAQPETVIGEVGIAQNPYIFHSYQNIAVYFALLFSVFHYIAPDYRFIDRKIQTTAIKWAPNEERRKNKIVATF